MGYSAMIRAHYKELLMKRLLLLTATLIIGLSIFSSAVAAKTKDCREVQYKKKCIATIESTDFGTFTGIFHRRVFKGKTVGEIGQKGKYEGGLINENFSGQGTLSMFDNFYYEGGFKEGQLHGTGTMYFAEALGEYSGEWKDSKYEGQGTLTLADGDKYVGEWKDGNENGQGTVTYPDGNKYVGEWKDGNENGQFTEINANGDKTKRLYEEGIFKGYVQDKILKVADASQINKMALTLKGISFGMTEQQRINVLLDRGYSCFGGKSLFGAYSLTCEIKAEGQKIEINKTSVVFSCQNFNLCSFSAREAGQKLMEQLDMLSMENKTYSLPGYRFPVKNYCGRGPEGDEICVERLDGFGGVPLTLTLKAGDISRGKVSFD
jgi:hypothetical protein